MKKDPKSARDTNTTIPLGKRNKSAPDKDVTMEEQKILATYLTIKEKES